MNIDNTIAKEGVVLIVEDDISLRTALAAALKVRSIDHLEFENSNEVSSFLAKGSVNKPTCMLLDIRLGSGPTGLSVFDQITELKLAEQVPVIFMTGHGDLDTAVDVMKHGAFDFVTKPFSTPDLIKKIMAALESSKVAIKEESERSSLSLLLEQLTEKEAEVMRLMVEGKTNREIAEIGGNSTRTAELHRARVFDKLKVSNAVELTRILSVLNK